MAKCLGVVLPELIDLTDRTSFSSLTTYYTCPERWRQLKILERQRTPGWALVGGKAAHTITELFDVTWLTAGDPGPGSWDWFAVWREQFDRLIAEEVEASGIQPDGWRVTGRATKEWPDKETRAWWDHHGPIFGERWELWRRQNPEWQIWQAPDGKSGVELEILSEVGESKVLAFIDRVFVLNGQLVVVDLKSGRNMPETILQLAVYAALIELEYGVRPQLGAYWDARKGRTVHLEDLSPIPTGMVVDLVNRFVIAASSEAFLPVVGRHCTYCEVKQHCPWSKALTYGLRGGA